MEMKSYAWSLLGRIRETSPLIHNITNFVVMNSSANILLALGASPVMAHSIKEIDEMTGMASALVLNIGTIDEDWIPAMIRAAKIANQKQIPVVLDPVGSGATRFRTGTVERILKETEIAVIRGNASEVLSLTAADVKTRGVDSSVTLSDEIADAARGIATAHNCVVAISGKQDLITDGRDVLRVGNGQALMTRVTGIGCGLSAVVAAFCAVDPNDLLHATAAAFGYYGLCGDIAVNVNDKPGSFYVAFLDALYAITKDDINSLMKVNP